MNNDDKPSNEGWEDWKDFRNEDGFPVPCEERDGELFIHPTWTTRLTNEPQIYVCCFIEELGWCWYPLHD